MDPTERERLVKSEARRAIFTQVSLGLCAAFGALTCLLSAVLVYAPIDESAEMSGLADTLKSVSLALSLLAWISTLFLSTIGYLFWLYRAHQAADAVESPSREHTPTSAVLTFFIPFLNLIRPYQAVKGLYDMLDPSDLPSPAAITLPASPGAIYRENTITPQVEIATPPAPLSAWWAFWIMGNVAFQLVGRGGEGHTFDRMSSVAWMIASSFNAIGAVLCVMVIRAVDARTRERNRRISLRGM